MPHRKSAQTTGKTIPKAHSVKNPAMDFPPPKATALPDIPAVKQGKRTWKKLRIYTKEGVYKISFAYLTHGKDDFMAEVLKMVEKYEIIISE